MLASSRSAGAGRTFALRDRKYQALEGRALLAGQMAVQGNVGGGSFVCGLKRILTPHDSIDMQCALGELCIILAPLW